MVLKKISKFWGGLNLTWPKVIILAVLSGIYASLMLILPITQDTSFSDIGVSFEVWILFGIFIIMNSKSAMDSALKCFVFFLISQPLIYLLQVLCGAVDWGIFTYYSYWFIWTIATLPMGFIGWYMKKDKWWGLLILAPVLVFLGFHFSRYLGMTMFSFPKHLLTTLFCAGTMILYPLAIFKNKKIKIVGLIISIVILLVSTFLTIQKPSTYETDILTNGGSAGATFNDSYKVYLTDESFGTVEIKFIEQGLNDWVVHAIFTKDGNTELVLEAPNGQKKLYEITIDRSSYTIEQK